MCRRVGAESLKPKHVKRLLARWQGEGPAVGTIKNRMAERRWWAEKTGNQNVMARSVMGQRCSAIQVVQR